MLRGQMQLSAEQNSHRRTMQSPQQSNATISHRIEPMNFRNRPINSTKALFQGTLWHLQPKKIKRIAMEKMNQYEILEDEDLDEYGDYTNPWKLHCAATSNFAGEQTGILRQKKTTLQE